MTEFKVGDKITFTQKFKDEVEADSSSFGQDVLETVRKPYSTIIEARPEDYRLDDAGGKWAGWHFIPYVPPVVLPDELFDL